MMCILKCRLNSGASTVINHNIGIRQGYNFSISDEEISFDGLNGSHSSFGFHFFTIFTFRQNTRVMVSWVVDH